MRVGPFRTRFRTRRPTGNSCVFILSATHLLNSLANFKADRIIWIFLQVSCGNNRRSHGKSVVRQDETLVGFRRKEDMCAAAAAPLKKMRFLCLRALAFAVLASHLTWGGEGPFFITYTHQMEEPGNL